METQAQDKSADAIVLSSEQQFAADEFRKWFEEFPNTRRPFFVIEGFAGTGKSFSINTIIEEQNLNAQFMAYTGKAALVLQKYAGVNAKTIHSTIYKVKHIPDQVFKELYKRIEETDDAGAVKEIENEIARLKQPEFELNLDAFEEDTPDILVLDECSMVDDEMLADLTSFGIPIVALGDPGQLPPVKGEGALFKGLADARLTEIRRQALESPIIKWSMWAREKRPLPMGSPDDYLSEEASRIPKGMLNDDALMNLWTHHDITLCWRNKTRQDMNNFVRKQLGHYAQDAHYPIAGETLIITKNDKQKGIFNGMFCVVKEVGNILDNYIDVEVTTELGKDLELKLLRAPFDEYVDPDAMKKLRPWDFKDTQQADFGYVITCHKSQGSQWDRVLVMDEDVFNWYKGDAQDKRAQWMYTAITRAAKQVTIVSGR